MPTQPQPPNAPQTKSLDNLPGCIFSWTPQGVFVAISGIVILALIAFVNQWISIPTPTPQNTSLSLRVENTQGQALANAHVELFLSNRPAPLSDVTTHQGLVIFPLKSADAGQNARMIVTRDGCQPYKGFVPIQFDILPSTIQLSCP